MLRKCLQSHNEQIIIFGGDSDHCLDPGICIIVLIAILEVLGLEQVMCPTSAFLDEINGLLKVLRVHSFPVWFCFLSVIFKSKLAPS